MVAFELARYFETSGNPTDAGRWYLTAAERFRRSDWKTKAQESATRLGATEPAEIPAPTARQSATEAASGESDAPPPSTAEEDAAPAAEEQPAAETKTAEARPASRTGDARRRRGRRGGREHRGASTPATRDRSSSAREDAPVREHTASPREAEEEASSRPSGRIQRSGDVTLPSLGGRSGDPGLSSRLSQMQMNFRRLVACDPVTHEEAGSAPAGPGVWVLTDSDLSTYYYVEACQTLRVAIPNVFRNASVRRGDSIKGQLAEHLGITEARVSKYLADHCVVRWLQMDEGAAHFAHFLVAVLQPALNE